MCFQVLFLIFTFTIRGFYVDGKLASAKPGQSAEPKAVAGTVGTTILVSNLFCPDEKIEDMFYNSIARRKAMASSGDEYQKILAVVTKYSVHFPSVSFSCKKVMLRSPLNF